MIKYRLLSDEELSHFEEEFKQFLIVNGVYDQEWKKLNAENPEAALQLVGLFSDQILQRVYEKIAFLEIRQKESCFVFHLEADQMHLIAMQLSQQAPSVVELSSPESIHEAITKHSSFISYFRQSKKYQLSREEEIHQLMEQGAVLSDRVFWESLEKTL